jgi:hypothetical protein
VTLEQVTAFFIGLIIVVFVGYIRYRRGRVAGLEEARWIILLHMHNTNKVSHTIIDAAAMIDKRITEVESGRR